MGARPMMTGADRAQRRKRIASACKRGGLPREVAARFGVSLKTVYTAAHEHGVAINSRRGRPRVWRDCPEHLIADYDLMVRKGRLPAAKVKSILEGNVHV